MLLVEEVFRAIGDKGHLVPIFEIDQIPVTVPSRAFIRVRKSLHCGVCPNWTRLVLAELIAAAVSVAH